MAKVSVKTLQALSGDYGQVERGATIQLEEKDATRLAKAGVVEMEGVEADGSKAAKTTGNRVTAGLNAPKHMDSDKRINRDNEKAAPTKTAKKK